MENIYVIGHKNPDADSVCSAFAYAKLKSMVDPHHTYIPARCGRLNKQSDFIFKRVGEQPPVFIGDVYPRVKDVMTGDVVCVKEQDPLFYVMRDVKTRNIRLTPVVNNECILSGIVSVFEISDYFAGGDVEEKPYYQFNIKNIVSILNGHLYKSGNIKEFKAQIIIGAMPFTRFREYIERCNLREVIVVVGKRMKILDYSIKNNVAAIILAGLKKTSEIKEVNFSGYHGHVVISDFDSAETMRRLVLSTPVNSIMRKNPDTVHKDDHLERAREKMATSNVRGLPVVDDHGKLVGIVTRSDLIKRYAKKVILMDHNELSQAVDGIETAEIIEVVDHHRLGTIKTTRPIHFCAKPVGSTSTLVSELYREYNITPDPSTALILLSGVLSDTIILKSPTTTDEDMKAAETLSKIAGVNIAEYGTELFSSTDSLNSREPQEIVNSDFKIYEEYGVKFGIGQVEVVNLEEIRETKNKLIKELERIKNERNLDWTMLLITDIVKEDSVLLTTGYTCEKALPYMKRGEKEYFLPDVLSRKKQLLPTILGVLESYSKKMI